MRKYGLLLPPIIAVAASPQPTTATAQNDDGVVSEIRVGALLHDAAIITDRVEPASADANFEILFASPDFLAFMWSPRPHLGATVNTQGATSQAYFGLTWDWDATDRVFFEAGFGGSVHNGEIDTTNAGPDEKALGCRLLFRGSLAFGYRLTEHNNLSIMADHVSNAYLCDPNPGLDTVGIRWGYRF